jgi:zinc transport system ATP-binding protein
MSGSTRAAPPSVPSHAIEIQGLGIRRGGVTILDGVDLVVAPGVFLGIVGPNGGGKTTLVRTIVGLERVDQGVVRVLGLPPGVSREIGYLPQIPTFDPRFPALVRDVVAMGLTWKQSRGDGNRAIDRSIDDLGLNSLAGKPAGVLSGGEKQRLFLARALVRNPRLLILDEPTLGVDVTALDSFLHLLDELRKKRGLTIVMVSHDFSVVSTHATQVICLAQSIHFCGSPRDLDEGKLTEVFGIHNIFLEHRH